jgi:phosphatidylserine/phosphatidylglycerophosphate/cardiolipin synthase-like enzyme
VLLALLGAGCLPAQEKQPGGNLPVALLAAAPANGWLEVHFTIPPIDGASSYRGGPDEALVEAVDAARLSVEVAAYSLNLWSVRDALIRAERRGVIVRVVMESDNMDEPEVQDLVAAGIPVVGDQRQGLMHDKFVVIDRAEVWTGSMNYTLGGSYYDDNNLIRIRSTQVAEDYTLEFEEMFTDNLFGPDVNPATPHPLLTVDGTALEVYFSPDDRASARLIELLGQAQESIYFLAFSFTSDDLAAVILERAEAGVNVAGVMDDSQVMSNEGTEYDPFLQAGLDVRLDGGEGLMHHKVIVIDRRIVVAGSYNFTFSAEYDNDENVIIIFSEAAAGDFLAEFQRIYDRAGPVE